jgi:hypothetical protein
MTRKDHLVILLLTVLLAGAGVVADERPVIGSGTGEINIGALPVTAEAGELADLLCTTLPMFCAPMQAIVPLTAPPSGTNVALLRSVGASYLITVPGIERDGGGIFDAVLLVGQDANGELILTLIAARQGTSPSGATYTTVSGLGFIPEIELEGDGGASGAAALELERIAGSVPMQLKVTSVSPL